MGGISVKLSSVRYFLTVAEHKSFTRASEILFVTQTTLSRQIQLLEEELGTKLFYRDYINRSASPRTASCSAKRQRS